MIFSGSKVGLVDESLATYRLRRDSLSTQPLGVLQARIAALEGDRLEVDRATGRSRSLEG